ncbi:MAG: thymidine phosphorylase [Thermoleophilia bacterium]|nr:thymidine phosphorylase [Thermoleophilia bacterium]MDH3725442.1 thymidine phosphorylase [Thermoleophilia bacterium]
MSDPSAVEVIRRKRDGRELSDEQIAWFLRGYTAGEVPDEQASALLMAILFRGLTERELATWTTLMIASGERLNLSGLSLPTIDKHSTGGVGDKISLPLVPLVAACGAAVPMLSGRGLGHTGGTLDKLEAIPGFRTKVSNAHFVTQLNTVGAGIIAAGPGLVPADQRLYALRDVTGTVESIPLIASSIMSKKIAEGTRALVLDVKVGAGAFMRDEDSARELAEIMVGLGEAHRVRTVALLTAMDAPLGRAVGNGLEVQEALDVLAGGGPSDVVELTVALAAEMLQLAGIDEDPAQALADGRAMDRWRAMVRAQGGDPDARLMTAPLREDVFAERSGIVERVDALAVGEAAWRLGAGRARKEDPVSPTAGVTLEVVEGDEVEAGAVLARLHADEEPALAAGREAFGPAIAIGSRSPRERPLVMGRVAPRGSR